MKLEIMCVNCLGQKICTSGINNDVVYKGVNTIFVEKKSTCCLNVEKGRIFLLFLDYTKPIFFAMDAKTWWLSSSMFTFFIIVIGAYTMDWSFEYTRESSYWKMPKSKLDL